MEKNKIFGVFGLGAFGYQICKVLAGKGANVIAIDRKEDLIDKIKDIVTQSILTDTTDEDALRNCGVADVDVAIVAMGDNKEASILTTALLKNLGVPYIIARATSDIHAQVLKQIGATEVIILEIDEGERLANRLLAPDVLDVVPISQNQCIAEIRISKKFAGKNLLQLDLRKNFNVNVVSIKRMITTIDNVGNPKKDEQILNPSPIDLLEGEDVLVVLGTEKDVEKMKGTFA